MRGVPYTAATASPMTKQSIDFAGPVHHFLFRARDPWRRCPHAGLVEPALVEQVDDDGVMSGGIHDDLAFQCDGIDVNDIVAGHLGGGVVHHDAFEDTIFSQIRSTTRVRR